MPAGEVAGEASLASASTLTSVEVPLLEHVPDPCLELLLGAARISGCRRSHPLRPHRRSDKLHYDPDPDRFQELLHSMILKHSDGFEPISTGEFATFAAFRSTVLARGHIELGGRIFKAIPWSPSYGGEQTSLAKFVRIVISEVPAGLLQHEIASQLLSPFILVEGTDIPGQGLVDTDNYSCFGWVDSVIDIPDYITIYITIYITPRGCHSDYMHTGHHYMALYMRRAKITVESPSMMRN